MRLIDGEATYVHDGSYTCTAVKNQNAAALLAGIAGKTVARVGTAARTLGSPQVEDPSEDQLTVYFTDGTAWHVSGYDMPGGGAGLDHEILKPDPT